KIDHTEKGFSEVLINDYEMHQKGETIQRTFSNNLFNENIEMSMKVKFFFKKEPNENDIIWYNYWSPFFNEDERVKKEIESSYGIILICLENALYAISLGIGYHYANRVAVEDFGFEIAEKIIKENSISLKSVKIYKQTKSRSLTQYYGTFAPSEVGESNELLIGKLDITPELDDWLLKEYTDDAVFSTSVKVSSKEFKPVEILKLVYEFHQVYHSKLIKKKTHFPRLKPLINNEQNKLIKDDLNKLLLNNIKNGKSSDVTLSYFTESDGQIVIHPLHSDVIIKCGRKNKMAKFEIDSIGKVISEMGCTDIDLIKINSINNDKPPKHLKHLLDYNTRHHNLKHYCLFKGRWAEFNESYMEFIDREIEKVNDVAEFDDKYNLYQSTLESGNILIKDSPKKYNLNKPYTEFSYNVSIAKKYNYKLYDRQEVHEVFKDVEFADLYNEKNKELIHVKIGYSAEWRYCIQQSSQVAPLYHIYEEQLLQDNLPEVKVLTLLLIVNVNNIFEGTAI